MDSEGETGADGQDRDQDAPDRNTQPQYPDLIVIVREQLEQHEQRGPDGTAAPADADPDRDRGHKASTPPTAPGPFIDGVVSPRDLRLQHQKEHPELVEDLKVFLGLKPKPPSTQQVEPLQTVLETGELADPADPAHATQPPLQTVELADPAHATQPPLQTVELADPYHAKPPQPASAAEAMSAHDGQAGQAPGSQSAPQSGGDAPSSVLDCAALAAPVVALAVAGPSRHGRDAVDGDPRHGARSAACSHGAETSVEDRCLECCVYYGVMCCQCSIS